MTEANDNYETMHFDTDGGIMEQEPFHEASDEIPLSLLSYFETSRSRAAVCERLILEELEDPQTQSDSVDLSFSEGVLESLNELQVDRCLTPGFTNTEALLTFNLNSEDEAGTDLEEVMEIALNEEELSRSRGHTTEREKRLCEELEMEEQWRRRETEFEEELRRLEEAERLQQAEVELMAKRAQEKLEQEMLLQQEMMKDLKRRVEEERKKRTEEQTRLKEEQERRQREEEERRKTEQMRKRQKEQQLKQERDEKMKMRTEKMNVVLKLTEDEVRKDGFRIRSDEEERQKVEVEQRQKEMNLKTESLGKRKDGETHRRQENKFERMSKQEVDSVISKNVTTINEKEDMTQGKTGKAKEGNKDWDKTKPLDEEVKTMNNVTYKEEEKQERQHNRETGMNCNMRNQSKTNDGQEKRNEIQNTEDIALQLKSAVEENHHKMKKASMFKQENSAANEKTRKDNCKKRISISCNFLQKGFKMMQKTVANDKSNETECEEEGSSIKTSSSFDSLQNKIKIIPETIENHCESVDNVYHEEDRSSSSDSLQNVPTVSPTSFDFAPKVYTVPQQKTNNGEDLNEVYEHGGKVIPNEVSTNSSQRVKDDSRVSSEETSSGKNKSLDNSKAKQHGSNNIIHVGIVQALNEEGKFMKTSSTCEESVSTISQETRRSDISMSTNMNEEEGRSGEASSNGESVQNVSTTGQETGINRNKTGNKQEDRLIKTFPNCQSLQNVSKVSEQHENKENNSVQTSLNDRLLQNKTSKHQKLNTTAPSCDSVREETTQHGNNKSIIEASILETEDEEERLTITMARAQNSDQMKSIFAKVNEEDNKTKASSNCDPIQNESSIKKQYENRNSQIHINSTANRKVRQETIQHGNRDIIGGDCGEIKGSSSCDPSQNKSFKSSETRQNGNNKGLCKERNGGLDQTCSSNESLKNVFTNSRETPQCSSQILSRVNGQNEDEEKCNRAAILETTKEAEASSNRTSSSCHSLQNVSTVIFQNSRHKNVNEAAIFEIRNEEEGSSTKTEASCESSKTVSTINRETTQSDCSFRTRSNDTNNTLIEGVDCFIKTSANKINTTASNEEVHKQESTLPLCLPERTEQKRMKWMKDCVPWSTLCLQKKRSNTGLVPNQRGSKRTAARCVSLPPLSPQTLLQATAQTSLKEVTTVTLEDLPGSSVSTLAQCSRLRSLTLRRCGLKALDSISQLPELCCVDVQENEISYVDCENMTCLRVLRLGHNKLTSVHGLSGAEGLAVLDLSHNNIRRIAGLESLKRLQSLSLSHNQLISTKGLSAVSTLLHLDLSHNHLASVEGLENCALLGSLVLKGNSLSQPPVLNNHVLLRELHLDDNSLSSLHSLTENWLPMMQHLSVAQNSITQLPCLSDFVSLKTLDLQFNCISELSAVCETLKLCRFVRELRVSGNPLQQETGWRCTLQKAVPGLSSIDEQQTDSLSSSPAAPCFIPASGSFLSLCQTQLQQIKELRQRHDTEISTATTPLDVLTISGRHLNEVLRLAEQHRFQHEYGDTAVTSGSDRNVSAPAENHGLHHQNLNYKNAAAALIQQRWRKHKQECTNKRSPSTDTGHRGGEGGGRAAGRVDKRDDKCDRAATIIQAFWRGVSLRRRLLSALAAASYPGGGQDDSFEEVDVDEFVFDEASLETEWSLRLSEDYTPRLYPKLERPLSVKAPVSSLGPSHWSPPSAADCGPKQAWTEPDDSVETVSPEISHRSRTPPSSTVLTGLSKTSEKLVEEWGLTDSHTTLLMLKRAQKMKPKKQQQKLKDPNVRLALFKSCASQMNPVEARHRPVPRNRPYLQVGEAEPEPEQTDGEKQRTRSRRQTENTQSERFLPELSWDVLNGGRVQLVVDPGRQHVAAGLCLSSQSCPGIGPSRRNCVGHSRKDVPCPKRVSSAPCKKERISFRDNVVQLSGGWGSGKKRHKVTK